MGKDQRNIDRGRCKVDDCDCQEFELETKSFSCGYCVDPPAKHILVETDPKSEPEVPEISASKTAPPLPTNRWMDKIFGWIPNAKRKTGIFYNEVLKSLYNSYWPYCGDHKIFRTFFMTERNRQYLYRADIDNVKTKIAYIKSENLACAGKFLTENYVPQPGDKDNIVRLTSALEDQQKVLEEINARLEKDDEALFCKNGTGSGRLKSGRHSFHHFNEDTMYAVKLLNTSITNLKNQLLAVKKSLTASFWKPVNKKLNDKQRRRQNKWKCEKRTQKRKLERCSQLFEMLGGTIVLIGNSFLQRCLV